MSLVQPRLSRGLRDLLPEDTLARQAMIDVVRGVYELYGFVPLTTPAVEYLDVLSGSGGKEIQESIFVVRNPEEEELGLRFDHTVPLARVIAQYKELPKPFRRYTIGPVWRADKPGPGRFREFVQFDIDSVGVQSEMADTEIIGGICDSLEALGVSNYQVRFSSRRVLNLLLTYASITPERAADVFRVIDKLEKIGIAKVRLELTTGYTDESGDKIPGLGLTAAQVDQIEQFLADPLGQQIRSRQATARHLWLHTWRRRRDRGSREDVALPRCRRIPRRPRGHRSHHCQRPGVLQRACL